MLFSLTANFPDNRHVDFRGHHLFSLCVWGEEIGVSGSPGERQPLPGESLMRGLGGVDCVPTAASAFKGSKGTWERPLVALSHKGIWGTPQEAKMVIPEGGRLQVGRAEGPWSHPGPGPQAPHYCQRVFQMFLI